MDKELTLGELYKQIGEQLRVRPDKAGDTVCIALTGGAGGTKTVNVRYAHCGGDWDKGKFLIYPTEILTKEGK